MSVNQRRVDQHPTNDRVQLGVLWRRMDLSMSSVSALYSLATDILKSFATGNGQHS